MIRLDQVVVRAHADDRRLSEIDHLDIGVGDRICVTGESGSGKSLLLGVIADRLPGTVVRTGVRRCTFARDSVAIVPQRGTDALHPLLPVERQLQTVTGSERGRVRDVLGRMGLAPRLHRRRPSELSGGQAQRAALALAILSNAPIVVADEPTSALDAETRDELLALLAHGLEPSTALVIATHDERVVASLGGRRIDVAGGVARERMPAS
ncbi:MAG: hypothetical protein ABS61_10215 [Microbacterium sp. SCN 70-18]|nr:ATP-binding cassette domain-containing protein [Microbacterium chocolatum]ODT10068.1 MAG: hypothetical protein ABS61_10215 [Microbacterium sp. SCN 70-18]